MKKIEKWRTVSRTGIIWYHVHRVTNGKIEDYNKYRSRSGRNKKVIRLKKQFPNYKITAK